jgi:hypothetical protein
LKTGHNNNNSNNNKCNNKQKKKKKKKRRRRRRKKKRSGRPSECTTCVTGSEEKIYCTEGSQAFPAPF